MTYTLSDLGWSDFFQDQISLETPDDLPPAPLLTPARITSVHKSIYNALSESGPCTLWAKPNRSDPTTVGDWVLADQDSQIIQRLERRTTLQRGAAGDTGRKQLIAANIDVLFIVTSCNNDFNPARLERYLVLAGSAGAQPVIVLTKPDLCETPESYAKQARSLGVDLPVLIVNARDPVQAAQLTEWWHKGQTAALLGSSGVGKSTLAATLTGEDIATQGIRDQDAKGRHTTTARNLYYASHGGWLLDTPGMRSLQLADASEGIATVFGDLVTLAGQCRFRDCNHEQEPGCAIQAEISAGRIEPDRIRRWQKLDREDRISTQSPAQAHHRAKPVGRNQKPALGERSRRKKR